VCVSFLFTASVWNTFRGFVKKNVKKTKNKTSFIRRAQPFVLFPLFKHSYMFRSRMTTGIGLPTQNLRVR